MPASNFPASEQPLLEANIDALVGPSHHFGGLGVGNVASLEHFNQVSHPKRAALEGLQKAALVAQLGVPQYLWLPPDRPRLEWLAQLGFTGSPADQLKAAHESAPRALSAAFSSAFMWAANAGTVTPATDATDGRYHFTPANLISSWHRAAEAESRQSDLNRWFGARSDCVVHDPLPSILPLRDEGAANHMRLSAGDGRIGFNVFVHGEGEQPLDTPPRLFPRHTQAASEALARQHQLRSSRTFFLQQNPEAISAGVFHNDVIATSHRNLLIHHERAFLDADAELNRLETAFAKDTGTNLQRIVIAEDELTLADAVNSYLFNSQIVSPTSQDNDAAQMIMICPQQCEAVTAARQVVERLIADPNVSIDEVQFVSLAESMANGGGPACLRLRLPAESGLLDSIPAALKVTNQSVDHFSAVIERYYPDELRLQDLSEPDLVEQLMLAAARLRDVLIA